MTARLPLAWIGACVAISWTAFSAEPREDPAGALPEGTLEAVTGTVKKLVGSMGSHLPL